MFRHVNVKLEKFIFFIQLYIFIMTPDVFLSNSFQCACEYYKHSTLFKLNSLFIERQYNNALSQSSANIINVFRKPDCFV